VRPSGARRTLGSVAKQRELECEATACRLCGAVVIWVVRHPERAQYPQGRACSCGGTGHELEHLGTVLLGVLPQRTQATSA
jgi:hypothetical protein